VKWSRFEAATHVLIPWSVDSNGQAPVSVTDRYRYDPYGDTAAHTGASSNPWRYTGAFLDEANGFYKMGLRFYDPDLGRWTQQDALQNLLQPAQANRYAYVGCNPTNYTDPSGLFGETIDFGAFECDSVGLGLGLGLFLGGFALDVASGLAALASLGVFTAGAVAGIISGTSSAIGGIILVFQACGFI